jgi:hypothetical protein
MKDHAHLLAEEALKPVQGLGEFDRPDGVHMG